MLFFFFLPKNTYFPLIPAFPSCSVLWLTDSSCCFQGSLDTGCVNRILDVGKGGGSLSTHCPMLALGGSTVHGCISSIFPASSREVLGPTGGLRCWALGISLLPHSPSALGVGGGMGLVSSCFVNLRFVSHHCLFDFQACSMPLNWFPVLNSFPWTTWHEICFPDRTLTNILCLSRCHI